MMTFTHRLRTETLLLCTKVFILAVAAPIFVFADLFSYLFDLAGTKKGRRWMTKAVLVTAAVITAVHFAESLLDNQSEVMVEALRLALKVITSFKLVLMGGELGIFTISGFIMLGATAAMHSVYNKYYTNKTQGRQLLDNQIFDNARLQTEHSCYSKSLYYQKSSWLKPGRLIRS